MDRSEVEEFFQKYIIKIHGKYIINKADALRFLKENGFKDYDIISSHFLGIIKYSDNYYYCSRNFGLLLTQLIDYCKMILNLKRDFVLFWPKVVTDISERLPIFLTSSQKHIGILIYSEDLSFLK